MDTTATRPAGCGAGNNAQSVSLPLQLAGSRPPRTTTFGGTRDAPGLASFARSILPTPSPAPNAAGLCASSPSSTVRRSSRRSCGTSSCGILPSDRRRPARREGCNPTRTFLPGRPEAGFGTASNEAGRPRQRARAGRQRQALGAVCPAAAGQRARRSLLLARLGLSRPDPHPRHGRVPLSAGFARQEG